MLAKLLFATERLVKDQNGLLNEQFIQLACSSPNQSHPSTYKQIKTINDNETTIDRSSPAVQYILQKNWDTFLNAIGLHKCNNNCHHDCNCPFIVASNMVKVSFGSKLPMSAEEGEILRNYFKNYWQ
jgi:hypothetical protein